MPLLFCSSFSRVAGSDSDFTLPSGSAGALGAVAQQGEYSRVRLVEATVVWNVYNAIAGVNDSLLVEVEGEGQFEAFIPAGVYNIETLPVALGTALGSATDALDANWLVSFSTTTRRCTITCSDAFKVLPPSRGRLAGLNQILGFSLSSASPNFLTTQVAPRAYNMARYPQLYIWSSLVDATSCFNASYGPSEGTSSGQLQPLLSVLPSATWAPGSIAHWQLSAPGGWVTLTDRRLSSLRFSLRDEQGGLVDPGGYVCLTLEVQ